MSSISTIIHPLPATNPPHEGETLYIARLKPNTPLTLAIFRPGTSAPLGFLPTSVAKDLEETLQHQPELSCTYQSPKPKTKFPSIYINLASNPPAAKPPAVGGGTEAKSISAICRHLNFHPALTEAALRAEGHQLYLIRDDCFLITSSKPNLKIDCARQSIQPAH